MRANGWASVRKSHGMGNASSRQKITQPLLDAASSWLRRTQIWDKFQVLVQRIKDVVGFGVSV